MKFKLPHPEKLWSDLRSSLWFTPSFIAFVFLSSALVAIWLDREYSELIIRTWPEAFKSSSLGAQSILSVIATSMMTVAGVVFSITIVALTMASSQYSPRILRTFMRDQGNQTVLGVFVGVFLYCLLVLRSGEFDQTTFSSPVSLLVGMVCAVIAIGFLIYFIHHIAMVIQVSHVIATISDETITTVRHRDPFLIKVEDENDDSDNSISQPEVWGEGEDQVSVIPASMSGYLQRVEISYLRKVAEKHELFIRIPHRIGDFIVEGKTLAILYPVVPEKEEVMFNDVRSNISLSRNQTIDQDVSFGLRLIVDVALKALSPGVNDTTTAVMAIDYLTAILDVLAKESERCDQESWNRGRVWVEQVTLPDYIGVAFNQIRQTAENNVTISIKLMKALILLTKATNHDKAKAVLSDQVEMIYQAALQQKFQPGDLDVITELKAEFENL